MIKKEADYDSFDIEYEWGNDREFNVLQGQTITNVFSSSDEIIFTTSEGYEYRMFHDQDCCESVDIESIVGDLSDLIGQEIILAEERISSEKQSWEGTGVDEYGTFTWTFYTIRTLKTSIDIRWYGESNGYYSETVTLRRTK